MLCQRCNEKEATVHLTKIVNGQKTEIYLCEDCAKESGNIPFANNPFSFQNLLSGILNPDVGKYDKSKTDIECKECGSSYREFSNKGLFGCSSCYEEFNKRLDPLFKRIHGNIRHNGKVPKRKGGNLRVKRKIKGLREEMQQAVDAENFEKAAEIRDKIKELKENIGGE